MRKDQAEVTEVPKQKGTPSEKQNPASKRNWRPVIIMGIILILAAFVRVAFSFGTSAGSDFALSGGTASSDNLRFITSLLNGELLITDASQYYPYGSVTTASLLFNVVMCAFAGAFNVFCGDINTAASLALAVSGPLFAVLACIPMYFLGKELFGNKLAGYLSALFLALCPIVVRQSVFSNGEGLSFTLLLFIIAAIFVVKMVKSFNGANSEGIKGIISGNKAAVKFAVVAGIFLALTAISWTGFRAVILPLIAVMVIQVLIDRFKGKNPMPMAFLYSLVVLLAVIIAGVYYIVVGLWDTVASGPVFAGAFAAVACVAFAALGKKPWTITIPAFVIVTAVIFAVLAFVMPDLFSAIINGNTVVNPAYADVSGTHMTLSMYAAFFGWLTYWFVFFSVAIMLYKVKENISSPVYVFTVVWLLASALLGVSDIESSVITAPIFALGFAFFTKFVLDHIDFKAYFAGIKTAQGKTKLRRVISPKPFVAILVALLLVAAPNMVNVIDASISSSDVSEYNESVNGVIGDRFGGLTYTIQTDDLWEVRGAMTDLNGKIGDGATVSWLEYSDDIAIYGNGLSLTDTLGNGAVSASNILLANGTNGESTAAMMIALLVYYGFTEDVQTALKSAGFDETDVKVFKAVLENDNAKVPADKGDSEEDWKSVKSLVISDIEKYGAVSADISAENVKYLYLTGYLSENFSGYEISVLYEEVCDLTGKDIKYVAVSGDMFPLFYGYSSVFTQMALLNGYSTGGYGEASKYTVFDYNTYYYGIFGMTDAMYDSLLYRTYIGMTPAEAGYGSLYEYVVALSAADSNVKVQPGYGLSNYEVVYWQVMYNDNDNAVASDDGWKQMDAKEAQELQKKQGGVINYLSGIPVVLGYVDATGSAVSGKVTDAAGGIEGVRVSVVDADGIQYATEFTDADGAFQIYVRDVANSTIVYYYGGTGIDGGVYLGSKAASGSLDLTASVETQLTIDASFYINGSASSMTGSQYVVDIEGDNFSCTTDLGAGAVTVPLGTYTIKISQNGKEIISSEYTTVAQAAQVAVLTADVYDITFTVTDEYGAKVKGATLTLSGTATASGVIGADGKVVISVPKGDYIASFSDGYVPKSSSVSVSSSTSKTITALPGKEVAVKATAGTMVTISSIGYMTSFVSTGDDKVSVPVSSIGKSVYTFTSVIGDKIAYKTVDVTSSASVDLASGNAMTKIEGTLSNGSGSDVYFIAGDGSVFTAVVDGSKFTAYVPQGVNTVYATNNSLAYFGTLADDNKIELKTADRIYGTVSWSDDVDYGYLSVDTEINGSKFTLMTNSDGRYQMYVPADMAVSFTVSEDNAALSFKEEGGDKFVVDADHKTKSKDHDLTVASEVTIKNDLGTGADGLKLKIGSEEKKVGDKFKMDDNRLSVTLGVKSTTEESSLYYYSGTFYFTPATEVALSALVGAGTVEDAKKAAGFVSVTINDLSDDAKVSFISENGSSYKGYTSEGATQYLLNYTGEGYVLKVTEEGKVYYSNIDGKEIKNVDVTVALADACEVSGFVGYAADGDLTVTMDGISFVTAVNDGKYSFTAIKGKEATLDAVLESETGKYTAKGKVTATADMIYNFAAEGSENVIEIKEPTVTAGENVEVTYKIPAKAVTNNTGKAQVYKLVAGAGWDSIAFMTGENKVITSFTLAAGGESPEITVKGAYKSGLYTLASTELIVTIDGSPEYKVIMDDSKSKPAALDYGTIVNTSEAIVGDYSYSYVIEITNLDGFTKTFDISGIAEKDGWFTTVEVDGLYSGIVKGEAGKYTVKAQPGVTKVMIEFTPEGADADVPNLNATVTCTTTEVASIYTTDDDNVKISGKSATVTGEPTDAEVEVTEMEADGRGVVNDKGAVPVIVWALLAIIVLLAILTVWMATKRGVFARRK